MNTRQVWGLAGGFFLVYIIITLTNKPHPKSSDQQPGHADQPNAAATTAPEGAQHGREAFQKGFAFMPAAGGKLSDAISDGTLAAMAAAGADSVAIMPVLMQENATSDAVDLDPKVSPAGDELKEVLAKAKSAGLKVMLRPLVAAKDGSRREDFAPAHPDVWVTSYGEAIAPWLAIAQEQGVAVVCLGAGYGGTVTSPAWPQLISTARQKFQGKLTYGAAARDGQYKAVPFWPALDYMGVEAYFPLASGKWPQDSELEEGWTKAGEDLEAWQKEVGAKPILFTSVGYPSQVGMAGAPDRPKAGGEADDKAQEAAYRAFFKTLYGKPWLAGTYWNAFSGDAAAGPANPFAVQHRPALAIVTQNYQK